MMQLEICVDSVESAIAAESGGAQRVELCSDLFEGGITPSSGLIESTRRNVALGVFVMVRPRGGDSCYTDHEFEAMRYDVIQAKDLGADGVVLGLLDAEGRVDVERTRKLVELAHPMQVTFHRAFDMSADLSESLESVIEAGAYRILTSGGRQNVLQGADHVAKLIQLAHGRIGVMAGGSIRQENIEQIAALTGAAEFHCSLRTQIDSPVVFRNQELQLGTVANDEFARYTVLEEDVRELREALDHIQNGVGSQVAKRSRV
jgi:copper homeostasis protein